MAKCFTVMYVLVFCSILFSASDIILPSMLIVIITIYVILQQFSRPLSGPQFRVSFNMSINWGEDKSEKSPQPHSRSLLQCRSLLAK